MDFSPSPPPPSIGQLIQFWITFIFEGRNSPPKFFFHFSFLWHVSCFEYFSDSGQDFFHPTNFFAVFAPSCGWSKAPHNATKHSSFLWKSARDDTKMSMKRNSAVHDSWTQLQTCAGRNVTSNSCSEGSFKKKCHQQIRPLFLPQFQRKI